MNANVNPTTTTKLFLVTLGNVAPRPGHRHDCAQVELAIHVNAASASEALDKVRQLATEGPIAVTSHALSHLTLTLNPAHLGARSVRVEEVG
jgi:hypothetical protein